MSLPAALVNIVVKEEAALQGAFGAVVRNGTAPTTGRNPIVHKLAVDEIPAIALRRYGTTNTIRYAKETARIVGEVTRKDGVFCLVAVPQISSSVSNSATQTC